jgi:hypothetical protein
MRRRGFVARRVIASKTIRFSQRHHHRNGVRESRAVGHSYYTKQVSNNDIDWGEYNAYNQEGEKDHGSARRQSETGRRHD